MRLITIFFILPLLTACGASSSIKYTTVSVFKDKGGVFLGSNKEGQTVIGMSPYVAEVVASSNDSTSSNSADLDKNSFNLLSSNSFGKIRQGSLTVGSRAVNVLVYEDTAEIAGLFLVPVPSEGLLMMAGGDKLNGLPTGTFRYSGQNVVSVRASGSYREVGTFVLDVDFTSQKFDFAGTTASNTINGSGVIDSSNGRFGSNSLSFRRNGTKYDATMYGVFSGTNAKAVSGIYHTNDAYPDFAGGFVGSR